MWRLGLGGIGKALRRPLFFLHRFSPPSPPRSAATALPASTRPRPVTGAMRGGGGALNVGGYNEAR